MYWIVWYPRVRGICVRWRVCARYDPRTCNNEMPREKWYIIEWNCFKEVLSVLFFKFYIWLSRTSFQKVKNNSIDSWTSAEENLVVCALVRFSTWNMSQHVATGWPNVCNILPPAMLRSVTFKGCDRLAGACKYWANNVGICCVEMLLSFGRDFKFYIWLEQFHLKIVENNSLRLMSLLINRTCRSY